MGRTVYKIVIYLIMQMAQNYFVAYLLMLVYGCNLNDSLMRSEQTELVATLINS